MDKKLNSKLGWIIAILLVFLSVVFFTGIIKQTSDVFNQNAGAGIDLDKYHLDGGDYNATTSPYYLSANASTTLTMSVSNSKHIDLNIWAKSTSTVPAITWITYFSSDDGANKNWYPEGGYTATSNILRTEGVSPLIHTWTPTATTTVGEAWSKNIGIEPVASKYMKIQFSSTKNIDLYVEGITQSDTN